mmetsp:Transcript_19889/g.29959  ORF Transcript_19889/g.29959 Transcript_19889/m.29959 type:complete len:86 (-) Transcript_19889:615-872(-)
MSASTTLLSLAKSSGRCPPSLIVEGRIIQGSQFEATLLHALDGQGMILSSEPNAVEVFSSAMKVSYFLMHSGDLGTVLLFLSLVR